MSTVPDVCTLVWPFIDKRDTAGDEDGWLIGWNPRGLVVVVVMVVRSPAIEDALRTLKEMKGHAGVVGSSSCNSSSSRDDYSYGGTKHHSQQEEHEQRGIPSAASLLVLGRLVSSTSRPHLDVEDRVRERADRWVRTERQLSDIWLELNRGPVLDQVWCCGYRVQPCHLHVIRTDPKIRYSVSPTVYSATSRFGCNGIDALLQGRKPLCISGSHSTLEGVLLPPHMIPLAGPCTKVSFRIDENSATHNSSRRIKEEKEEIVDSNTSMDDVANTTPTNTSSSITRRDREKGDTQSFSPDLYHELSPLPPPPPVNGLPPRLNFPTSADYAELSLLLSANNFAQVLRESFELREKNEKSVKKNTSGKWVSWEAHLHAFIGMLVTLLLFFVPILTWFGKVSYTAALLEFRLREIIHWLALLQGRTHVCGLHPVLPHMQHEDPAFLRFCLINFLSRVVVDGLLGTVCSLLLAVGGKALVTKSSDFCRTFLYDIHMGYMDWFEGWPAGLKMNEDLNMTLCFFAKLMLQTSWDFAVNFNWVEIVYKLLVYISLCGASCAFALLSDVCVLVSLHLILLSHAISVPYRVMVSTMHSLYLQFRGKKYNPLRRRTDAYDFEVDQMLMGTLLFTVTVFLFPTLATYHVYFALVRGATLAAQAALTAAAHLTLYLPLAPLLCWATQRHGGGGVALSTPKVTHVRHHANTAGPTQRASTTVEVTVLAKPIQLRLLLGDFLLVLHTFAKLWPRPLLTVFCNAEDPDVTPPVEQLIPHLRKDCVHANVRMFTQPETAASVSASASASTTTATTSKTVGKNITTPSAKATMSMSASGASSIVR
ncbi:DNA-directed RNA polymerase II subunit 3 [Trypanosoma theileri]|uniref:DNA-directed RNA polymerase II subunit 3 n=1 Tax=Trypanosoma theileri TaxID=67003 RepID=A0A1X0P0N1_9TRYP|nr:DNA-directed RNA polymerase II subunit 3 [Trypanosoma theileri]ORC90273.1 DNA-directed RNA polymerase II subunit 3 [Trypanosoma theileri]